MPIAGTWLGVTTIVWWNMICGSGTGITTPYTPLQEAARCATHYRCGSVLYIVVHSRGVPLPYRSSTLLLPWRREKQATTLSAKLTPTKRSLLKTIIQLGIQWGTVNTLVVPTHGLPFCACRSLRGTAFYPRQRRACAWALTLPTRTPHLPPATPPPLPAHYLPTPPDGPFRTRSLYARRRWSNHDVRAGVLLRSHRQPPFFYNLTTLGRFWTL